MKFFRETLLNFLNWCINLSLNTQITCSYFVGNAAQSIKTVGCNCNCSQLWAPLFHYKLFSFVFHEDLIFIKCGYSTFGLWGASSCFSIFIHVLLHLTSYCTSLRCSVFFMVIFYFIVVHRNWCCDGCCRNKVTFREIVAKCFFSRLFQTFQRLLQTSLKT